MPELPQPAPGKRARDAAERIARVAERQWGPIARAQLERCGLSGSAISRWVRNGRLHRRYPGVYTLGHRHLSVEGELAAALLYAGPGAALSHTTGAWWRDLIDGRPALIHVSTPRRCSSVGDVRVHHRPGLQREWHEGLPTSLVPQLLLQLAALGARRTVRKALARAEY